MKHVKLILLALTAMLFLGIGNVNAQVSSSVVITTITEGKKITLQVVDDQNNVTIEKFKHSEESPEQVFLKIEMDKWIKKGYNISQSYGYSVVTSGNSTITLNTRYETIILSKTE